MNLKKLFKFLFNTLKISIVTVVIISSGLVIWGLMIYLLFAYLKLTSFILIFIFSLSFAVLFGFYCVFLTKRRFYQKAYDEFINSCNKLIGSQKKR